MIKWLIFSDLFQLPSEIPKFQMHSTPFKDFQSFQFIKELHFDWRNYSWKVVKTKTSSYYITITTTIVINDKREKVPIIAIVGLNSLQATNDWKVINSLALH